MKKVNGTRNNSLEIPSCSGRIKSTFGKYTTIKKNKLAK